MNVPDLKKLTDRQKEIYLYIVRHWGADGQYPTIRAIADKFGISSTNGVVATLVALRKKGFITWERSGKSLGYRIPYFQDAAKRLADIWLAELKAAQKSEPRKAKT